MTTDIRQGSRKRRTTIRTAMILILIVGLMLGLGWPAWQVYREKDYHVHTAVDVRGAGASLTIMGGMESPFWPRYWRRLLGRPYQGQPYCNPTPGFGAEICEYADPSMALRIGGQVGYHNNSRQVEWMANYEANRARTSPGP
ncbi:hypothetical protein P12x_000507 [Tundrisphaera lichenicola]|uniref:hypothetical protein n=1 Tax=Tundrisphaera lichenicola TaxID=2029860 RepID=UPI003EB6A3F3